MYTLTISGHFDAAHHLPGVEVCCNPHGHTWQVEVVICSESLNDNMMVVDFRKVKDTWKSFDHKDLNTILAMPTAEAIAHNLFHRLVSIVSPAVVKEVSVWESPDSRVTYTGEENYNR